MFYYDVLKLFLQKIIFNDIMTFVYKWQYFCCLIKYLKYKLHFMSKKNKKEKDLVEDEMLTVEKE